MRRSWGAYWRREKGLSEKAKAVVTIDPAAIERAFRALHDRYVVHGRVTGWCDDLSPRAAELLNQLSNEVMKPDDPPLLADEGGDALYAKGRG